jgi:hypothetical protein
MTTLSNRPNTALLVIDVQNGVIGAAHERAAVVANVAQLVERARREEVSVVWVQHDDEQMPKGSDGWHIVAELEPDGGEPRVEKNYFDSFEETRRPLRPSGGPADRGRSSDRRLHPIHPARRHRPRLRRHSGE